MQSGRIKWDIMTIDSNVRIMIDNVRDLYHNCLSVTTDKKGSRGVIIRLYRCAEDKGRPERAIYETSDRSEWLVKSDKLIAAHCESAQYLKSTPPEFIDWRGLNENAVADFFKNQ